MKTYFSTIATIIFFLTACKTTNDVVSNRLFQKRKYTKGFHYNGTKKKIDHKKNIKYSKYQESEIVQNTIGVSDKKNNEKNTRLIENENQVNLVVNKRVSKLDQKHILIPSESNFDDCGDILVMKNGDEVKVKVISVEISEIKYKKCSNPEGPTYTSKKSEVFMIKYKNGEKDVFKGESKSEESQEATEDKKVNKKPIEPLALASAISGGISLFGFILIAVGGGIFALLALIFAWISLRKLKKEPNSYSKSSKSLAIIGLVIGILGTIGVLIWLGIIIAIF